MWICWSGRSIWGSFILSGVISLLCGFQVLSEDLATEKMREDSQDGESLVSVGELSFRECWWNKVLESQRTGGDQYRPAVDGCQATTDLEG
jgi:hypothetical protein